MFILSDDSKRLPLPIVISDTRSDGIYTQLIDEPVAYTREVDHDRVIDYAADGTPVGIDLLGVSEGIDLSDLPHGDAIVDLWIEQLGQKYRIEDYPEVLSYLIANPFLIGILLEAPGKVGGHFGPDTPLDLEIFTDPEDEDSQELFVLIHADLTPEQALQRLANLDREWWLETSALTRCRLNLDIRYIDSHHS
jgi:uncharacterized protein YuzE